MTVDGGEVNTITTYGPDWARNPVAQQRSRYIDRQQNPFRFNDDMIIMPLQAASQWDALSHVYYDDRLYNGFPADSVTSLGAYRAGSTRLTAKASPRRGVLLDLVRHHDAEVFPRTREPDDAGRTR